MSALQHQVTGVEDFAEMPSVAVRLRIGRLKSLALAFLSQFESFGSLEPININRGIDLRNEVRRFEVELIKTALDYTGGNQRRAARLLGLKPTTLNTKMKNYKMLDQSDLVSEPGAPTTV